MKPKAYRVVIEKKVAKDIKRIEPKQREIILSWIEKSLEGCSNPFNLPNAKKLEGINNGVRYRIGKYRILAVIDIDQIVILVFRIKHRNSVYQNIVL